MQPSDLGAFGYALVFILGTAVGSFLNVVIYRVPVGRSIVKPASHCPRCNRSIKPYENIPIISYLLLRGRCAGCKTPISPRYPIVEAVMGLLAMLLYSHFGWSVDLAFYTALTAFLLALSVIDIDTYRLPNPITLTGAILAIVLTLAVKQDHLLYMLLGGFVGFGLLALMGFLGRLLFRKETLGMGDVKLAGMIGLYLGPWHTAGMFVLGVFSGAVIGGVLMIVGRKGWGQRIPFGPYLALGSLVSLLWGEQIWRWYVSLAFR